MAKTAVFTRAEFQAFKRVALAGRATIGAFAVEKGADPLDVACLLAKVIASEDPPTPCGGCGTDAALDSTKLCSACAWRVSQRGRRG